jgi:hypothetical protein
MVLGVLGTISMINGQIEEETAVDRADVCGIPSGLRIAIRRIRTPMTLLASSLPHITPASNSVQRMQIV